MTCACRLGSASGSGAGVCRCFYEWRGPHGAKRDRVSVSPERPLRVSIGDLIAARGKTAP